MTELFLTVQLNSFISHKTAPKRDSDSYSLIFRNFPFKKAKSVKKV